jgi:glyoxylase-like metal-dependent hydrolase (beta-lactamase superfamily II)
MESEIFHKIGEAERLELYPYIRKIDMMSSNSYIISSSGQIGLIDPGGLDVQMDRLMEVIRHLYDERPRPVVVYLTHVHADHSFELCRSSIFEDFDRVAVAVQAEGARSLERGDPKMTLSHLLRKEISPISPEVTLLSLGDLTKPVRRRLDLGRGAALEYETASLGIGGGIVLNSQRMDLGAGDALEIYRTPGHSPDSICIRAGDVLFLGDLLLASNPGVAGLPGWSREDQMESIRRILWVLERGEVRLCYPGHGRPLNVETTRRTLLQLLQYTESLGQVLIDEGWAKEAADNSTITIQELERLFTIIGGRLILISSVLEDLEEGDAAGDAEALVDIAALDALFFRWHDKIQRRRGEKEILDITLVHEAGRIVGKLDNIFERDGASELFEDHLLRRAERLLNDYMVTYRGFRPPQCLRTGDLNSILRGSIDGFLKKPYDEGAILEAETEEDYLRALAARISYVNLPERVAVTFEGSEGLPPAIVDGERLTDLVIDLLERLAAARAEEIAVRTFEDGGAVTVRISGRGPAVLDPFRHDEMRYLERSITLCGGALAGCGAGGDPTISFRFQSG